MEINYDVFISYSRKDYVDSKKQVLPNNVLSTIKELLKSHDISYWFDEDGIYIVVKSLQALSPKQSEHQLFFCLYHLRIQMLLYGQAMKLQ